MALKREQTRAPFIDLKDSGRIDFRNNRFVGPERPTLRGERVVDITFDDVDHLDTADSKDTGDGEGRPWFDRHPWWSGLILISAGAVITLVLSLIFP
jgi:hypothetical protein